MEYKIVKAVSLKKLEVIINDHLDQGWVLIETSTIIENGMYCKELKRETNKKLLKG